jgi:hypothetical protein
MSVKKKVTVPVGGLLTRSPVSLGRHYSIVMSFSEVEGVKVAGCRYGPAEHGPCLGDELLGVGEAACAKMSELAPAEEFPDMRRKQGAA